MTIVETTRPVTGGVDTHLDVHVAAAVDANGGLLGVESFPTTPAGYRRAARGWRRSGTVDRVGVEGTGAYGAGLARHLRGQGVDGDRGRSSEPAGRAGTASPTRSTRSRRPGRRCRVERGDRKSADGNVEAIRALLVARRSGRNVRIKYLNQIRHLGFTAPDELRERLRGRASRPAGAHRGGVAPHPRAATPSCTRPNSRSPRWAGACSPSKPTATRLDARPRAHSCGAPRRACSRSTASGSTPPRSCWSPPATTPTGSTPKPRSRTSAASHRSPPRPARPTDTDSTPAGTAKPTMPSGGSCSPAWAATNAPANTSRAALAEGAPRPRDHAHPQALRRPRDLPAPRARLNDQERRAWPTNAPTPPAVLRTIRRPATPNTLGTAWPHKSSPSPEWPITGLPAPPNRPLTTHRSIARERLRATGRAR